MSIHDIGSKIKGRLGLDHIALINMVVIVLVGICAFGLGRISAQSPKIDESIAILDSQAVPYKSPISSFIKEDTNSTTKGQYLASKNGKLYYNVGCSGANRIKEENKIWFNTKEEAESRGLTMSSTCK